MLTDIQPADAEQMIPLAIDVDARVDAWIDHLPDIEARIDDIASKMWAALELRDRPYEVSVVLADDDFQQTLNRQFRDKESSTNVLSFPSDTDEAAFPVDEPLPLGDVVLAFETLKREAEASETAFEDHFAHLLVHGMLHLVGFDHQTEHDAEEMEAVEIDVLASLGIANPYDADATLDIDR